MTESSRVGIGEWVGIRFQEWRAAGRDWVLSADVCNGRAPELWSEGCGGVAGRSVCASESTRVFDLRGSVERDDAAHVCVESVMVINPKNKEQFGMNGGVRCGCVHWDYFRLVKQFLGKHCDWISTPNLGPDSDPRFLVVLKGNNM